MYCCCIHLHTFTHFTRGKPALHTVKTALETPHTDMALGVRTKSLTKELFWPVLKFLKYGLKSDPILEIWQNFEVRWGNAAGLSAQFYDGLQLPPLS